jgi:MFS transporter, DHA2 family, multidrug resistance protein
VTEFFIARGSDSASAAHQALMWVGQTIDRQATLLSFIDVSWAIIIVALLTIPLAFVLRQVELGKPRIGH